MSLNPKPRPESPDGYKREPDAKTPSHENMDRPNSGQPIAPQPPAPPRQAIPYIRADKSPRRNGSVNTATAGIDGRGTAAAMVVCFTYVCEKLQARKPPKVPVYTLDPASASRAAGSDVADTSPLAAPIETAAQLVDRCRQLAILSKGQPSPHAPDIDVGVAVAVDGQFSQVVESLENVGTDNPLALGRLAESAKDHIDGLAYAEVQHDGLAQLTRIAHALQAIDIDPTVIPEHKRDTIIRGLLRKGHQASIDELKALTTAAVEHHYRRTAIELRKRLDVWRRQATACQEHLDAVHARLNDRLTDASHIADTADRDAVILLNGPTQETVLNRLAEAFQTSRDELMERLADVYLATLLENHSDLVASELEVGPMQVLAVVGPDDGAATFERLCRDKLTDLSLYAAVAAYGAEQLARDLFDRAEPLVYLSRQSGRHNIELTPVTVLAVPPALGKDDEGTLKALSDALQAITPVKIDHGSPSDQRMHLTRSVMGFPAAVLADNGVLARTYVESRRIDHFPHLFGFLPDSPDGRASEIHVEFFNQLQYKETSYGSFTPNSFDYEDGNGDHEITDDPA